MALKRVYRVKRSPYLYSVRNFSSYSMWDVTNTPPPPMQTQRPRVPQDCRAKQMNTPTGPNKPLHRGRRLALILFVTICSQLCRYCLLCTQRDPHVFKTHLQGYEEFILIQCQELSLLFDVGCHKHPPCRHNVLVVSHRIVGLNRQTPLLD